ncbi:ribbon-helix-helix domain-containing protein [Fontivita pretiosa]|jgi:antitoxin ParD1/3/4|uniref:ribbon-helix-helix domain-containing protein n=1 Tax=Fontivita pretiosa TaxID=2989684 RepID=UPI003D16C319
MTKLDISLPEDVRALAEQRVAGGGYASLSEYLADLIRRDQQRIERERTEQHLLDRLQSGPPREMTDRDFDQIRQRVEDEIARRQPK